MRPLKYRCKPSIKWAKLCHLRINNKLIQTTYDAYTLSSDLNSKLRVDFTEIAFGMHKYNELGYASDGTHLGPEAHEQFAQDLHTEAVAKSLI